MYEWCIFIWVHMHITSCSKKFLHSLHVGEANQLLAQPWGGSTTSRNKKPTVAVIGGSVVPRCLRSTATGPIWFPARHPGIKPQERWRFWLDGVSERNSEGYFFSGVRLLLCFVLYVHVYVHICMYVYIYTYIYVYIYIHVHIERERECIERETD